MPLEWHEVQSSKKLIDFQAALAETGSRVA